MSTMRRRATALLSAFAVTAALVVVPGPAAQAVACGDTSQGCTSVMSARGSKGFLYVKVNFETRSYLARSGWVAKGSMYYSVPKGCTGTASPSFYGPLKGGAWYKALNGVTTTVTVQC